MKTYSVSLLFMEPRSISNLFGLGKRTSFLEVQHGDAETPEEALDQACVFADTFYTFKGKPLRDSNLKLRMKVVKEVYDFNTSVYAVFDAGGQGMKDAGCIGIFTSDEKAKETVGNKWVSIKEVEMDVLFENGI